MGPAWGRHRVMGTRDRHHPVRVRRGKGCFRDARRVFPLSSSSLCFPQGWEDPRLALTSRPHLAACPDRRAASPAERERRRQAKSTRNKPTGRDGSSTITFT